MKMHFDVLGMSRNASAEAVRAAFRQAAVAGLVGLGIVALVLPTTQQAFGSSHAPRIAAARANQLASQQVAAADDSGGRANDGDRAAPNGRLPGAGTGQPSASSPTGPAEALTPLAREWARVQASGDPMAVWAFAVNNPDAPEAGLALSRLIPLIEAAEDVSVLQDLRIAALSRLIPLIEAAEDVSALLDPRIAAMGVVAERAQLRLVRLDALAVGKEAVVKADGAVAKEDKVAVTGSSKGDQERALADYEAAIRIDPNNPAVFRDRGILWRRHGDLDRALVDFDRAIRLGFSDSDAYNERGLVWYEKRRYERAIADFNQAIKINPKLVSAFVNRGVAWRGKGDLDRAIADFDQAIRIEPSMPAAHYNLDLTRSEKRGVH